MSNFARFGIWIDDGHARQRVVFEGGEPRPAPRSERTADAGWIEVERFAEPSQIIVVVGGEIDPNRV